MKLKIWLPVAILLLAVIAGGTVWALRVRESAEVTEMRDLASKMMDRENVSDEERGKLRDRMREIGENMTDEQRREAFQGMRQQWTKRMREFAQLPQEERNAYLDQEIDRMEEMRQRWRERSDGDRGARGGARPGGGGRGGERAEGGRGGRGDWAKMSEEDREARRRSRLDNTSPEDRAYMMEYFKALNARREERGMEPMRGPWGRGGR